MTGKLAWTAHPARQRPGGAAVAMAVIAAVGGMVGFETGSIPAAVGGSVFIILALNRFFLPSTFVVDDEGITARYPLRRLRLRWIDVRRFVIDRHGGFLSTRASASRFDAWRGMHLLFGDSRDQVIQRIRSRITPGHATSGVLKGVPA